MSLAVKLTAAQYEKLADNLKGAYALTADNDFPYHLDVDRDAAEEAFAKPLVSTVKALRGEKKSVEDALAAEKQRLQLLGITDDEEVKEALETLRKRKEKELIEKGEVDVLRKQWEEGAVRELRTTKDNELKTERERNKTLAERLNKELIDGPVTAGCLSHGVRKTALPDVLARARKVWSVDDKGDVVPLGPDGQILRGADGNQLTFDEWFAKLEESAEHLFESNNGSGASNPAAAGGAPNGSGGLLRSKMTPKQKSDFIEKNGKPAYDALPW